MQNTQITICACASRSFISKEKVVEIATAMKDAGYHVAVEADLCRKVAESSPDLPAIASGVIVACHTRTILSHMDRAGLKPKQVEPMRDYTGEEVLSRFGLSCTNTKDTAEKDALRKKIEEFPVENGTDAWYPVIDKNRCVECGKCHDFCLFGVYTIENKRVRVTSPQNCKNNCPACARMCPSKAIIFPKYEKSPINGGTAEEEQFSPDEMDKMYRDRLRMRLQQRKASTSLLKNDDQ
ncbi:ferredoxin family protein [Bacteroides sp. UBA939]|uniref:ferredoxin family protein n=1 Tax=Bacteroides sp. UBA939 TaxID=1946092 RepID=UPI0025C1D363|nr:ferredoxin family protein [Bacteroides sp. UBA939]